MTVDERGRHELHKRLEEILDPETAATLMAHLPPGGWSNLATKQDVLELEGRLTGSLKSFTLWTILTINLVLAVAFAGLAFATR